MQSEVTHNIFDISLHTDISTNLRVCIPQILKKGHKRTVKHCPTLYRQGWWDIGNTWH